MGATTLPDTSPLPKVWAKLQARRVKRVVYRSNVGSVDLDRAWQRLICDAWRLAFAVLAGAMDNASIQFGVRVKGSKTSLYQEGASLAQYAINAHVQPFDEQRLQEHNLADPVELCPMGGWKCLRA